MIRGEANMNAATRQSGFHNFGNSFVFIIGVATAVLVSSAIAFGGDFLDAKTGKKLPAGGGEPGKAYMAFVDAVKNDDIAAVRKLHTGTEKETDSGMKEGIAFMKLTLPENLKVIEGYATADLAALSVTGTFEKEKQYGTIEMVRKKDGGWQVGHESWSNTPPGK